MDNDRAQEAALNGATNHNESMLYDHTDFIPCALANYNAFAVHSTAMIHKAAIHYVWMRRVIIMCGNTTVTSFASKFTNSFLTRLF